MVSNFFIGTSLEIVSCLQWAIISQWISSHRFSCRSLRYATIIRRVRPWRRAYSRGIISHGLSFLCSELCLFEALYPAPLARPFSKGLLAGDYLTWAFIPLRRIVPLRGAPSCAFGAALLQGPTRGGLSHMGFHSSAANCASPRHSILRLWRGPSPRAYSRGMSHMDFHAAATNCASSRHSILRLWRGPSSRTYSLGIISHGLSCRCDELCLFEVLYPAPLAQPFSKGLLAGIISHGLSCRCGELCLFKALYPAPLAQPFSKGLLAGDYLTRAFMPLQRIVPLRGTLSCAFGSALLQGPMRGSNAIKLSGRSSLAPHRGSCPKG